MRRFALALLASTLTLAAAPTLQEARALVQAKRYPDARVALEALLASEPRNAAACHELGLVLKRRGDDRALTDALKWLEKSVELEPNNALYLGDCGGTLLQLASRDKSISAAMHGRDLMEKAVQLDPAFIDAHDGLFQFYTRAPWPIGSSAKAAAHLEQIRQRDPDRATILTVLAKTNARDFTAAFRLCDEVLAKHPQNYIALYYYGRTASIAGENLERARTLLQQSLTLEPPSPAAPTHSNVWFRIGLIEEKLHHAAEARAAYETALKLDPANQQATDALAKLR